MLREGRGTDEWSNMQETETKQVSYLYTIHFQNIDVVMPWSQLKYVLFSKIFLNCLKLVIRDFNIKMINGLLLHF